jgi:hypothetical protein
MAKAFYTDIDLKRNQLLGARYENASVAPATPALGQVYFDTAQIKFLGWNGSVWIDLSQIINNAITVKGEITNANTSPALPTVFSVGDAYFITTTAGTVGGITVKIGDQIIRSTSGWFALEADLVAATTAVAGFVRLALASEVVTGTDPTTAVSPATLAAYISTVLFTKKYRTLVATVAANTAVTITHNLNLLNPEDAVVMTKLGGLDMELAVAYVTVNTLTITSNQALANVTVVVIG